jgi:predicted nucleic acid-binding protein
VTLPWCFEDEATTWTDSFLERLRAGDSIIVPAHWPAEISNGLLMAFRRKRILPGRSELFWNELGMLPIMVEPAITPALAKTVLSICERHSLTVYDGIYLELAKRMEYPLAPLDSALAKATLLEGVVLLTKS